MRFRKLRIAFSAACLIACLLLIVLWVRSYQKVDGFRSDNDFIYEDTQSRLYVVNSVDGNVYLSITDRDPMGEWVTTYNTNNRFAISSTNSSTTVTFPNLFPTLICIALGVVPWFRWRFSLRTLLIATTLFAVMLGVILYAVRR